MASVAGHTVREPGGALSPIATTMRIIKTDGIKSVRAEIITLCLSLNLAASPKAEKAATAASMQKSITVSTP